MSVDVGRAARSGRAVVGGGRGRQEGSFRRRVIDCNQRADGGVDDVQTSVRIGEHAADSRDLEGLRIRGIRGRAISEGYRAIDDGTAEVEGERLGYGVRRVPSSQEERGEEDE